MVEFNDAGISAFFVLNLTVALPQLVLFFFLRHWKWTSYIFAHRKTSFFERESSRIALFDKVGQGVKGLVSPLLSSQDDKDSLVEEILDASDDAEAQLDEEKEEVIDEHDQTLGDHSKDVEEPWFAWILTTIHATDSDIYKHCGFDAVAFLQFQKYMMYLFLLMSVTTTPWLIWINSMGTANQNKEFYVPGVVYDWATTNMDAESNYLYAHTAAALLITFITLYLIKSYLIDFQQKRRNFQFLEAEVNKNRRSPASMHTVRVDKLPRELTSERILFQYFNTNLYPGKVLAAHICRDMRDLVRIQQERDELRKTLKHLEDKYSVTREVPRSMFCCGKDRIMDLRLRIADKEQIIRALLNEAYPSTGVAFVTFRDPVTAKQCVQNFSFNKRKISVADMLIEVDPFIDPESAKRLAREAEAARKNTKRTGTQDEADEPGVQAHRSQSRLQRVKNKGKEVKQSIQYMRMSDELQLDEDNVWAVSLAPHQSEIIWSNLQIPPRQKVSRNYVIKAVTVLLVAFWGVPVGFLGNIKSLTSLPVVGNAFDFVLHLDVRVYSFVSGYLPTIVLVLFNSFLPSILTKFTLYEGVTTISHLHLETMQKLFLFLFCNTVIVPSLTIGLASTVASFITHVESEPAREIANLVLQITTPATNLFISLSIHSAITASSSELLRIGDLISNKLGRYLAVTPLERLRADQAIVTPFNYWQKYSTMLVSISIGMMFSVNAPITTPLVALLFVTQFFVDKYNLLYIHDRQQVTTDGRLHTQVLYYVLAILIVMQLSTVCLLSAKLFPIGAGIVFALLVWCFLFGFRLFQRFTEAIFTQDLVIETAARDANYGAINPTDSVSSLVDMQAKRSKLPRSYEIAFMHPAMKLSKDKTVDPLPAVGARSNLLANISSGITTGISGMASGITSLVNRNQDEEEEEEGEEGNEQDANGQTTGTETAAMAVEGERDVSGMTEEEREAYLREKAIRAQVGRKRKPRKLRKKKRRLLPDYLGGGLAPEKPNDAEKDGKGKGKGKGKDGGNGEDFSLDAGAGVARSSSMAIPGSSTGNTASPYAAANTSQMVVAYQPNGNGVQPQVPQPYDSGDSQAVGSFSNLYGSFSRGRIKDEFNEPDASDETDITDFLRRLRSQNVQLDEFVTRLVDPKKPRLMSGILRQPYTGTIAKLCNPLLNIVTCRAQHLRFIHMAIRFEIRYTTSPRQLFRANSICTRLLTELNRLVGMQYIHTLLTPVMSELEKRSSVFDLDALHKHSDQEQIATDLLDLAQRTLVSVLDSVQDTMPLLTKQMAFYVYLETAKHFPNNEYLALCGFFFARFLCPLIAHPVWYSSPQGPHVTNSNVFRQNTNMLAACLRQIASGQPFPEAWAQRDRFNQWMQDQLEPMRSFCHEIADPESIDMPVRALGQMDTKEAQKVLSWCAHHADQLANVLDVELDDNLLFMRRGPHASEDTGSVFSGYSNLTSDSLMGELEFDDDEFASNSVAGDADDASGYDGASSSAAAAAAASGVGNPSYGLDHSKASSNKKGDDDAEAEEDEGAKTAEDSYLENLDSVGMLSNKEYTALLRTGAYFQKYAAAKQGKSSKRYVWVSKDLRKVFWDKNDKQAKQGGTSSGCIKVKDIQRISRGQSTKAFGSKAASKADLCFSLISTERTLDLQLIPTGGPKGNLQPLVETEQWVKAFLFLKHGR